MTTEKENRQKNFVLRIDIDMMSIIEKWAIEEFRSVNGQILFLLDQALKKSGRLSKKKETKNSMMQT
ncbi:MAG: Arc family DNA-binding protein [Dysgonamonadaceae bacterium]|jgi:hypothetical protein|nr:Arc family DNA-binding protein [Dysgonamonadaceae bacterium]